MLDVSRRRTGWLLGGVVAAIAAAGLFAVQQDEPGGERVDEAVAAAVATPEDAATFAAALDAVAADGVDDRSALQLASVLPLHLEELQALDRPLVVDALTAMVATDDGAAVLAALSDRVVAVVDPVATGDASFDEAAAVLREQVAPVFVAAIDDLDDHVDAMRAVTEPARQELARRIAEREGIAVPPPELWDDLARAMTPEGDPITELEGAIHDQRGAEVPVLVWGPGAIG